MCGKPQKRMRILWLIGQVVVAFLVISCPFGRSISPAAAKSDPDKFIVKTTDGKVLHSLVLANMAELSNSFGTAIIGSFTFAEVNDDKAVSRCEKDILNNSYSPGTVSVWLGKAPIPFTREKHVWSGSAMRTDFAARDSHLIKNLHLTREVCISPTGKYLVSVRVTLGGRKNEAEAKPENIRLRYEPSGTAAVPWQTHVRIPDGDVKTLAATSAEWELTGDGNHAGEFLFGAEWSGSTSQPSDHSLRSEVIRDAMARHPSLTVMLKNVRSIKSLQATVRRVLERRFPGWDCPEPWLNRLWAAHIQAFAMIRVGEVSTQAFDCPVNDTDALRWVLDLRWTEQPPICPIVLSAASKNPPSSLATLASAEAAYQACRPDPEFHAEFLERTRRLRIPAPSQPEYAIHSEAELVAWCRSFYVKGDFNHVLDVASIGNGKRVHANFPVGVVDMVVRTIVGLRADGSDRLNICPAEWAGRWPYFAIDNLPYRGHNLAVVWQSPESSRRYEYVDVGYSVFVDGKLAGHSAKLEPVIIELK